MRPAISIASGCRLPLVAAAVVPLSRVREPCLSERAYRFAATNPLSGVKSGVNYTGPHCQERFQGTSSLRYIDGHRIDTEPSIGGDQ